MSASRVPKGVPRRKLAECLHSSTQVPQYCRHSTRPARNARNRPLQAVRVAIRAFAVFLISDAERDDHGTPGSETGRAGKQWDASWLRLSNCDGRAARRDPSQSSGWRPILLEAGPGCVPDFYWYYLLFFKMGQMGQGIWGGVTGESVESVPNSQGVRWCPRMRPTCPG